MQIQMIDGDACCQHGTAVDVHCCNCHSGFLFDSDACVCVFHRSWAERHPLPAALLCMLGALALGTAIAYLLVLEGVV